MRIGIVDSVSRTAAAATAFAQSVEADRFDTYWLAGGWRDPLTLAAVAGQTARQVTFGTAIVSVYGMHPTALAEQALTVNSALDGRLVLGIGTSHKHMVEQRFGGTFDKPVRQLREHLTILTSLLDTGKVDFDGQLLSAHTELRIQGVARPPILVSALSEQTLRVTGQLAEGTHTTWIAPPTLARHTIPLLFATAREAGRPDPQVVASMPICVTDDVDAARQQAVEEFDVYVTRYTAYKKAFELQGVRGPADVAVIGNEEAVTRELQRYADVGVTEFVANPFGTPDQKARTRTLVKELVAAR